MSAYTHAHTQLCGTRWGPGRGALSDICSSAQYQYVTSLLLLLLVSGFGAAVISSGPATVVRSPHLRRRTRIKRRRQLEAVGPPG